MLDDIVVRLDEDFSMYLAYIRENENQRIENERIRNEYFNQLVSEKKMYYGRYRRFYGTAEVGENTFELPNEYNSMSILDVYVNGFYMNPNEYTVQGNNVILTKALDEIGTKVEIVVTRAVGVPTENFEELRGFSAYEVAIRNGFEGTVDDWMSSLKGVGTYNKQTVCYTTTRNNENTFAMPAGYELGSYKEVYVNGLKLTENEYEVQHTANGYILVLENSLDVIGTVIEINIVKSDESIQALSNEEIDRLFI